MDDLTPKDIINQVIAKYGEKHPLTIVTKMIESGAPLPITMRAIPDMEITAFSNYFCEILHPIALQRDVFTGDAGKAAKLFLGTPSFDGTMISFGSTKTEGLSDSILTAADGRSIKFSSKAGKGASASIGNLANSINEMRQAKDKGLQKFLKSIKEAVIVTDIIDEYSSKEGPIQLALHYDIISNNEALQIKKLDRLAASGEVSYHELMEDSKKYLSAKLRKLFVGKATSKPDQADAFAHMITCIMYKTADHINFNTNFGVESAKILANAALVQVHTKVVEKGDKWIIKEFHTKYPGNFDVSVAIDPTKHYMSTKIKGKLTFKILAGGETSRKYFVNTPAKKGPVVKVAAKKSVSKLKASTGKVKVAKSKVTKKATNKGTVGRAER